MNIEKLIKYYTYLSIFGVSIPIIGIIRFIIEFDEIQKTSLFPLLFCLIMILINSVIGSFILIFIRNKIQKLKSYTLCLKLSWLLFLFLPTGLLFGLFSFYHLEQSWLKNEFQHNRHYE